MDDPIVCGVDVGSRTTKAVIMRGTSVLASSLTLTEVNAEHSARTAIENSIRTAETSWETIKCVVATGYGRLRLPFANYNITEISCHARGAYHIFPDVRTILDIGGQDSKAIRIAANGRVLTFAMNDKCAAGTGRCLERIAAAAGVTLDEIGPLSLMPVQEPLRVDTYCAAFAQTDTISLINEGKAPSDVLSAVLDGFASRVWSLLEKVGVEPELCITGGVGKNVGIVKRLENKSGKSIRLSPDMQIVGAIGAALIAQDKLSKKP
jgi:predicted CoA-substrate-specific enzyme activase